MSILATIYESSAFGPFLGVFLGFAVNYAYQSYKSNQDKNKYKSMIGSEFVICISLLEEEVIRLLPMDNWISSLNSGGLKLFEVEMELKPLTTLYNTIKEHNNDTPTGLTWKDLENRGSDLQLLQRRDSLLLELKKLRSEKWLEPKSWWQFWR